MAEITLPDDLIDRVEKILPQSASTEEFVKDAVQEKLALHERKAEFYLLSDEAQRLMAEKGISEEEILADFEAFRESLTRD